MKAYELTQPGGDGAALAITERKKGGGWYSTVYLEWLDQTLAKGPFDSEAIADRELDQMVGAVSQQLVMNIRELTPDEIVALVGN